MSFYFSERICPETLSWKMTEVCDDLWLPQTCINMCAHSKVQILVRVNTHTPTATSRKKGKKKRKEQKKEGRKREN